MPSPIARRATCWPIRPKPTMPSVLPSSSKPLQREPHAAWSRPPVRLPRSPPGRDLPAGGAAYTVRLDGTGDAGAGPDLRAHAEAHELARRERGRDAEDVEPADVADPEEPRGHV